MTGTAIVETTFQPENSTRVHEVAVTESSTRPGNCLAPYISQTFSQEDAEETALAASDPEGDVSLVTNNTLGSSEGLSPPESVDLSGTLVSVVGDPGEEALLASISTHGMIPSSLSGNETFLSFDFLILDPSVGETGPVLFEDALWDLSIDGSGPNQPLSPSAYVWNGLFHEEAPGLPMQVFQNGQWVAFVVPLVDLGMTPEQARNAEFRAVTQVFTNGLGPSQFFADHCALPAITDKTAFATCP